jgi:3-hydroxyacyl-[acyl-carrier-protein] dehydratase
MRLLFDDLRRYMSHVRDSIARHRGSLVRFILIDRVVRLERDHRIAAMSLPSLSLDALSFHFPARAVVPASLLIESFAQAATILLEVSGDFRAKAIPAIIDNAKFSREVVPGHELKIEAEIDQRREDGAILRLSATQRDVRCAVARMTMVRAPLESYYPPESLWMYRDMYAQWLSGAELVGFDSHPLDRLGHVLA